MNKVFTKNGWADYVYWQTEDRKTLKKINQLIEDIARNGNEGIGKPEPLTGNLTGFWSRRINDKDRLITGQMKIMCISLPVGIIIPIHENDKRPADKLICPLSNRRGISVCPQGVCNFFTVLSDSFLI